MESVGLWLGIGMGLALAVIGVVWIWRRSGEPSLIEKQVRTIGAQHTRMDRMQREIDDLRQTVVVNQESYEEDLDELWAIIDEWWHGMGRVFQQMDEAKMTPVWRPSPLPPRKRRTRPAPRSALAQRIERQFNIEEMNSLAYGLGIHSEEFGGDTRKARAEELVELAYRLGITAALVRQVDELRPKE
jgi:hypothetical protein